MIAEGDFLSFPALFMRDLDLLKLDITSRSFCTTYICTLTVMSSDHKFTDPATLLTLPLGYYWDAETDQAVLDLDGLTIPALCCQRRGATVADEVEMPDGDVFCEGEQDAEGETDDELESGPYFRTNEVEMIPKDRWTPKEAAEAGYASRRQGPVQNLVLSSHSTDSTTGHRPRRARVSSETLHCCINGCGAVASLFEEPFYLDRERRDPLRMDLTCLDNYHSLILRHTSAVSNKTTVDCETCDSRAYIKLKWASPPLQAMQVGLCHSLMLTHFAEWLVIEVWQGRGEQGARDRLRLLPKHSPQQE